MIRIKRYNFYFFPVLSFFLIINEASGQVKLKEKTSFQVSAPWRPEYDVRSDVAIVYGVNEGTAPFEQRVKGWKEKGYHVHFMTGIAWGTYQDYFLGKFDGKTHWDESQMQRNGDTIGHGRMIPYIVPTAPFIAYMQALVKRVVDAGITTIYLEEPEFWARGGYEESFKREWQKYYGFAWMPQHESPEATYLSSKLKYHLYYTALKEVFQYAKSYGERIGKRVKCFVPTHSLLNYSAWSIVSPEASLASLPGMDGYIAQVWTGTSREPTFFDGVRKERVFENAFLEYGSMLSMTAPTGRQMYFLTDPIEDRTNTWDDYKRNYQATFTAELMYPSVDHYEVMPWPNRIYMGKFKVEGTDARQPISPAYATQMQVMVNSLNDMPLSDNKLNGSHGIGVLLSNSMMFQRFPVHKSYEDPQLSNFYGMALPLLKKGVPVETVHMENLSFAGTLKNIKVLIMSYANMKPLSADVHTQLAAWVKKGGILIYYGRDNDPFQEVKEWWNTNGNKYKSPSIHLFEKLGIKFEENISNYVTRKGKVFVVRQDPKELVLKASADAGFVQLVKDAYEKISAGSRFETKNNFMLQRGPDLIAAVMDESVSSKPLHLKGSFIDLFDPGLPVLKEKLVAPGT
ncbi:MAG: hypothetical protein H7X88_04135, partial [Gloeobacteraceae cyanobacterium ES-bin-316]|nr:hypothetical protein [Ferruginibacter sp.]